MNQVNLIGRVGADPELRYTPTGKAVCEINLAVDDGWGENKKTAWIGVVLWEQKAQLVGKYVRKGDRLGITGRLSQDEWTDKETGKKQRKTKVICEAVHLLGDKRDGQSPPQQSQHNESKANAHQPQGQDDDGDDIPF